MKKITSFIAILLLSGLTVWGQNAVDALRFSQSQFSTTARSLSLGGAFGALGADFSVLSSNPAGIGVYRSSEFTFTPGMSYNTMNSKFMDHSFNEFEYDFGISNIGYISHLRLGTSGWKSLNFGFGYNRTQSFGNRTLIKSVNNESSFADQLIVNINNGNITQATSLAQQLQLLYTINDTWVNDFNNSDYGQMQRHVIEENGYSGEYVFSGGANFEDKLYLGATVGLSRIHYEQSIVHTEDEIPAAIDTLEGFQYMSQFETRARGYNFKFGALFRPAQWLRLGAAFHTPTFYYDIHDDYSDEFSAQFLGEEYVESSYGEYDYELTTPSKAILSAAVVLGKSAIISAEYEYANYSTARLRDGGDGYTFDDENESIQGLYEATNNFRFGAEYRIGTFALRGGYGYYDSPYVSGELNEDANMQSLSCGLGIRNENFFLDFGFARYFGDENYVLYQEPLPAIASIEKQYNQVLATIGFKF